MKTFILSFLFLCGSLAAQATLPSTLHPNGVGNDQYVLETTSSIPGGTPYPGDIKFIVDDVPGGVYNQIAFRPKALGRQNTSGMLTYTEIKVWLYIHSVTTSQLLAPRNVPQGNLIAHVNTPGALGPYQFTAPARMKTQQAEPFSVIIPFDNPVLIPQNATCEFFIEVQNPEGYLALDGLQTSRMPFATKIFTEPVERSCYTRQDNIITSYVHESNGSGLVGQMMFIFDGPPGVYLLSLAYPNGFPITFANGNPCFLHSDGLLATNSASTSYIPYVQGLYQSNLHFCWQYVGLDPNNGVIDIGSEHYFAIPFASILENQEPRHIGVYWNRAADLVSTQTPIFQLQ
jgi:hypothetical protein